VKRTRVDRIPLAHPMLTRIGEIADSTHTEVYVVGGYVRDTLLGMEDRDIDILVMGDGVRFARLVAKKLRMHPVVAYERFGTAMLPLDDGKVEFVGARKEQYETESRNPEVSPGSINDDLLRRDFTVNAMAASLNRDRFGELLDPLGGLQDLDRKLLRTPLDPAKTFDDDPLRMLRAIRFACQLQFSIDEHALAAITRMKDRLAIISQERITDEFFRILRTATPSIGLRLMHDTGIMDIVFPEVARMGGVDQRRDHHHKDVFLHTCLVVDNIAKTTDNVWLRFVALVHDIAKPRTKAFKEGIGWTFHGHEELGARMMKGIFRRMKLPLEHLGYVEKLVRLHLRPMVLVEESVTDSAVRRLAFEAGEEIDDLMKLCRADITSKNPRLVSKYLKNYDNVLMKIAEVEEKDRLRNWQPPVKGEEIMAVCGLEPGRKVGQIKKAIEEAILEGIIPNDHDAALEYLLRIKADILKADLPGKPREFRASR
jgi:poly(A) polymerase